MRTKLLLGVRACLWMLICLVTLELCARTEDRVRYGAPFFGNYSIDTLYQVDGLGKYGRPNSSYLKWHLNEIGYRGPGLRDGSYRIACMGSSETFGLYETAEKEWPRQLEDVLNRRAGAPDFEVIDVAFPGMSVGTNLRRLPQIFATLHPRMVVIYPSYTPYIEDDRPQKFPLDAGAAPGAARPLVQGFHWRIAGKLHTFMKDAIPLGVQDWLLEQQLRLATRGVQPMVRLPEQNVEAFASDLGTLTAQLTEHGVRVVLVTHADRFGGRLDPAERPVLEAWRAIYPGLADEALLDMERRMSAAVREVGAKQGVPVVDAAGLIPPGPANFVEYVHFTDAGSKALATLVADEIDREAAAGEIALPSVRPGLAQMQPR